MGISKLPRDSKQLVSDHTHLVTNLEYASAVCDQLEAAVKKSTERMLEEQAMAILKSIPVDEVNRDKRGIRIKSLKDHGYHTIADLYAASVSSLAEINGISDTGAFEIKQIVEEIASQARQGNKIRLSLDNRTESATCLVQALFQYIHSQEPARECGKLLTNNRQNIQYAIDDLQPRASTLRWLFSSRSNKEKALGAYTFLREQFDGDYGRKAHALLEDLTQIQNSATDTAWENFGKDSIRFFNALESLCPGVLGSDDGLYGLPEELAREIQNEPFLSDGLLCQLRHYQEWGVKYILHQKRVLLGDEMGLGKTVQAIASMVSLKNSGATHFLVVCPASVLENWCREIRKHSTLPVIKVHGDDRETAVNTWTEQGGVAVTTYETTGIFQLADTFRFSLAVLDEAHYIKNPEAQRTQNCKEICIHAERLLFMTGTALENKVEEMVSLISILQPQVAASVREMVSISSAPQFREKVAPVYYRRKRDDVLTELPELIENEEWCIMGPEEERVYESSVLKRNYAESRRVSWSAEHISQSSKASRMLELIEEAGDDGRKVIVFSFFLDTIAKIKELLQEQCLQPIDGSVPPQRRQEIVDEFNKAPAGTVLLAQIQAGGTGLNIQSASVVILCEPQFKPSIENQAISRAYRMGQTRNVLVYRLLCENSVDEKIMEILARKQAEFDAFADESVIANESFELDSTTFGSIINEEIERIRQKNAPQQVSQ